MNYAFFFCLAAAGGVMWSLWQGWKDEEIEPWRWGAVVMAGVVLGLLGSKLYVLAPAFWASAGDLSHAHHWHKSWLGGLTLASLGLLILRGWLRLPRRSLDLLVTPAFLGMALGRLGCLIGGCCLGTPTTLPWALHRAGGVGVHPVPVYEMLFAMGLALAFGRSGSRLRGRGFEAAVFLYFVFRFAEEFVRTGTSVLLGVLKIPHLVALAGALFWGWQLVRGENFGPTVDRPRSPAPGWVVACLLALAGAFGATLASPLERLVLCTATLLILTSTGLRALVSQDIALYRRRWALIVASATLAAVGLGFSAADDSVRRAPASTRLGMGFTLGRYEETCDGVHDVSGAAAYVERVWGEPRGTQGRMSLRIYAGVDDSEGGRLPIWVVNPYLAIDGRWIGAGLGFHIGQCVIDGDRRTFIPAFRARLGPKNVFFVYTDVGGALPMGYPIPGVQLGAGVGLGRAGQLRAGVSMAGFYIEPWFNLPGGVHMRPFLALAPEGTYQFSFVLSMPIPGRR